MAQFMPGGGLWVAGFGTAAPYSPARPPSGRLEVTAGNAREMPLVAAGASGQTASLFEARTGASTATSGVTVARIDGDGNFAALNIKRGKGTPEGVVPGTVGDLYLRLDGGTGTTLYVKETGAGTANGWLGK